MKYKILNFLVFLAFLLPFVFFAFVLGSMFREVTVYAGSLTLTVDSSYVIELPMYADVDVSDESVIAISEQKGYDGNKEYHIHALSEGYATVSFKDSLGDLGGDRIVYYDVFVNNAFAEISDIELRCVDTGDTVALKYKGNVQSAVLEFGAEYEVYANGVKLASNALLPCSKVVLTDVSEDGVQHKNLVLNGNGNIEVRGARNGSFVIGSELVGTVEIDYSVDSSVISTDDIARAYNRIAKSDLKPYEITADIANDITAIEVSSISGLMRASNALFERVFPNLTEITVTVNTSNTLSLGTFDLPSRIKKITFVSSDKESYAQIKANFAAVNNKDLHIIFDGGFDVSPSGITTDTPTALFSGYDSLRVESRLGGLYLSTVGASVPVPVFENIENLYLDVFTFDEYTSGYCEFSISAANGTAEHKDGADAVICKNLNVSLGKGVLKIKGGNGKDGTDGTSGANGTSSSHNGQNGTAGTSGGNGGFGITVSVFNIKLVQTNLVTALELTGGNGGKGGNGGNGGDGYKCDTTLDHNPGRGGDSAMGGNGGNSGYAMYVDTLISGDTDILFEARCKITYGTAGTRGMNGIGGDGGGCGNVLHLFSSDGKDGNEPSIYPTSGAENYIFYKDKNVTVEALKEMI